MTTTAESIRRGAAQHATRVAVRWGDDELSYREVFAIACRIGNALQDAGVGRGEHADETLWGACGQPAVDADIRLVDDDGKVVVGAGIGEIQVRAPFAMAGYYDADELNAECAVVGAPDPKWVEAVTAFIRIKPGHDVAEAEVIALVRSKLAPHKAPKAVHIVDDIPRSAVGKILRRALRDRLRQEQAQ